MDSMDQKNVYPKVSSQKMGNHQISPIYHPALQGPAPELTVRSKSKNKQLASMLIYNLQIFPLKVGQVNHIEPVWCGEPLQTQIEGLWDGLLFIVKYNWVVIQKTTFNIPGNVQSTVVSEILAMNDPLSWKSTKRGLCNSKRPDCGAVSTWVNWCRNTNTLWQNMGIKKREGYHDMNKWSRQLLWKQSVVGCPNQTAVGLLVEVLPAV